MRSAVLLVPLVFVVAACSPAMRTPSVDPAAERVRLLEVERGFSRESVERGMATAFREHLAEDAVELAGAQPIHGREAIAKALEDPPGGPRTQLEWSPEDGLVSGDLGYTWGHYTLTANGKSEHGKYLSVWRRGEGGVWKVIADIGTPDTK
jgi:ketosteroid isomerase-like protein